ncbi:outer membrane transport energization protein ExbB [Halospina denitrificans]|uniref:Outer membrane transport energization protein ExbB n=1 Tax=Halospina denitrificans TaxID=332522 RepID=A0A4R7K2N0_9GAMM|nr:MotA/TolQ/ExbB proton channel family protein [Halospina denitrificans]TDT44183.1 outer membrane transport energization protein ExbB [Halospina denitrificans]
MSESEPSISAVAGPIHELLAMGGPVMAILLGLSVIGLATALYALIIGVLQAPRASGKVYRAVDQWCDGDAHSAQRSLTSMRNPLAGLLAFVMKQRLAGETETNLRDEVGRRAQRLIMPFESPLKILEVIAALAPLLGLLGTVMGMMTAFDAMASAQGQANPSELSGGIYEALSTTAMGLAIAIPFAAVAAWMEFWLRRAQQRINDLLVRVFRRELPDTEQQTAPAPEKELTGDSSAEPVARRHAMA